MSQFPELLIDPKKKDRKYFLKFNKAVWDEFDHSVSNSFAKGADRYRKNKKYSLGKQSNAKYKKITKSTKDDNKSFMNINWDVLPVLPKFRRIVVERIGKIKLDIEAQAIDQYALKDKKKYESKEKANITLRDSLSQAGVPTQVLDTQESNQPQTLEELAMKMEFEYKHSMAIDIEKQVKAVLLENHEEEIFNEVVTNLFEYGVGGIRDWTDNKTGRVKFRSVDPANLVVSPSKSQFFRDLTYIGEIIYMTIAEIKVQAGEDMNDDQCELLADMVRGKWGNPKNYGDDTPYGKGYDSFRVPVLDLNFLALDRSVYEEYDKAGNKRIGKAKWKDQFDKKKNTYNDDRLVWYESKWVIDSDIVFDYSQSTDQKRKPSKLWDTIPNFHLVAPEMYDMETTSMVEQTIPIVDEILIAWYKLQNVMAQARPAGIAIEVGALEDVSMGDSGEAWTPIDILDLYNETGSIVWRRVDPNGDMTGYKPIEELNNSLGSQAEEYFNVIQQGFNMLRDMLGFNEVTDGSTPDARMLNGVANMADQSTSNSIYHIARARRNIYERLCDSLAVRVHDAIAFKNSTVYDNILGADGIKNIRENKDRIHREYGIFIRDNDDPQEKERLDLDIAEALKQREISIADKMAIMNVDNLKQRGLLLAYRIKRRQEELQAQAEADKMSNAQVQQDSARVAEEEKRMTLQTEYQAKAELERIKGEEERKTLELKLKIESRIKQESDGARFATELGKEQVKAQANQPQDQEEQLT